jgi:anti-sigma regulatory factor (Ser/Thr protein kinase)
VNVSGPECPVIVPDPGSGRGDGLAQRGRHGRNLGKVRDVHRRAGTPGTHRLRTEDTIASPLGRSPEPDLPHTVIDEGNRLIAVLPAEPRSAAHARSMVLVACSRWQALAVSADAELVVTELVANAVRHAGTEITVRLAVLAGTPGGVRAEVSDCSTRPVRPRHAGALEESGRGLFLVDTLSSRWGAEATTEGKTVWVEIVPDPGRG